MVAISWKDGYATNVACFDEEHKKLVEILSRYFVAHRQGLEDDALDEVMQELLIYAGYHFAHEERLMAENHYPGLKSHQQEHLCMVATVKGFQVLHAEGVQGVPVALCSFLRRWLLSHIVEEDHKYGPFFNARGIE